MQMRTFGRLGVVSALTLGGGGLGQVWGATTREEAVATVQREPAPDPFKEDWCALATRRLRETHEEP